MFSWFDKFQPAGILVLRVVLGAILLAQGYLRLFPHGPIRGVAFAIGRPELFLWPTSAAAIIEFLLGLLLIGGLFVRVAALCFAADLAVAVEKLHTHHGILIRNEYAYPLACFAIALMLVSSGAGPLALEHLVGRRGSSSGRAAPRRTAR